MQLTVLVLLIVTVPCLCQRPSYAGSRPIGYPEISKPAVEKDKNVGTNLPAALKGDKEYAIRLENMPKDQQPFWYLNAKQYEEQMRNPQTYSQRPSIFNENSG